MAESTGDGAALLLNEDEGVCGDEHEIKKAARAIRQQWANLFISEMGSVTHQCSATGGISDRFSRGLIGAATTW